MCGFSSHSLYDAQIQAFVLNLMHVINVSVSTLQIVIFNRFGILVNNNIAVEICANMNVCNTAKTCSVQNINSNTSATQTNM